MTTWTTVVPATEFGVGKPIKSEHGQLFYSNPIAMSEGAAGAPRFSTKALHPGGSEVDGDLTNATSLTGIGAFDFTSFTRSSALALPFSTIIRVNGNLSLSALATIATHTLAEARSAQVLGACLAGDGTTDGGGGGHSTGGAGGAGAGGFGIGNAAINRPWSMLRSILGGQGGGAGAGPSALGGGSLILIVHGDADFTGGTIRADGANGTGGNGGGGAGSIYVLCTGTITAGTYTAIGGAGTSVNGGGGAGGVIYLVASAFAGTRTKTVTAGSGTGTGVAGVAGVATETVLTEAQINALVTR